MPARRSVDPHELRAAVTAVAPWLRGEAPEPDRRVLGQAVRLSLRTLAAVAPGGAIEVRVPPFAAVQCGEGPTHSRGTPPNVVETDARTWLDLATGRAEWDEAVDSGRVSASGNRADLRAWLPMVKPDE
ncbi:hypothetical protein C1701_12090 [Actinoalloteichus sp. AHMU CJ021]|uniref:Bacterial SCP orthologue domain-containing protein n=1 Tax=Actinoalloteichus caeruleus DSM 43889 TaxID=1120930 RepID=A0ABT1JLJ8_ACTCY|nr:sterol carrier family protein [Actinoalloteichus caeruleus]AUS78975.1 hypothetical protein C1701_12090 [Actinoalloteichus sp. AHMU CJ021]MCP2333197.1 hypothetical protein [Actinoalloteichus caeruleus DSM 43889]